MLATSIRLSPTQNLLSSKPGTTKAVGANGEKGKTHAYTLISTSAVTGRTIFPAAREARIETW